MKPVSKYLIAFFFLVAFVGFIDASYLTLNHYTGVTPPCFIAQGCDVVTTSVYSKIAGLPVALLGALYYLLMLVLMLFFIDKEDPRALKLITVFTTLGFIASLWFLYAQVFLIQSLCTYCILSAVTSTLLFVCGLLFWKFTKRTDTQGL